MVRPTIYPQMMNIIEILLAKTPIHSKMKIFRIFLSNRNHMLNNNPIKILNR